MSSSRRRLVSAGVLALLPGSLLLLAAPASAGPDDLPTVAASGDEVVWRSHARATHEVLGHLTISRPRPELDSWTVTSSEAVRVASGPCQDNGETVVCTTPGPPRVLVRGGKARERIYLETQSDGGGSFAHPAAVRVGAGADLVFLGNVTGTVQAGSGDDRIELDTGPDAPRVASTPGTQVHGGAGRDTVSYAGSVLVSGLRVSLDGRANDGRADEHDNIHADVENLVGPRRGFVAIGNAAANRLVGGDARAADDRLVGKGGRDRLVGRNGDDLLDARDGEGGDRVDCGPGSDSVHLDRGDRMVAPAACETVRWTRGGGSR